MGRRDVVDAYTRSVGSDPIDPLVTTFVNGALKNLADNLMGVFDDLDDGGLTEDEALEQIRDIVTRAKEEA